MILRGKLFDGKTSASRDVEVHLYEDTLLRFVFADRSGDAMREYHLREARVSERIGNTPRRITLPDGAVCETNDNDTLDRWLEIVRGHSLEHHVFRLEQHWRVAVVALLITLIGSWLAIRYGVPALAGHAAKVIPTSVDATIGREGLAILDKTFFEPSQLPAERQEALREEFARMTDGLNANYRLEFRSSEKVGANAFALPSGIVVITDQLVELADDPREITAVLAHEIGHVVHRHSLRTIIQSSASAALMVALLGDFTSVSSLISATPALLLQAKYSRTFETEADDYSYAWMTEHNIPTHFLGDILLRMEEASESRGRTEDDKDSAFDFFASHPRTKDRIRE